MPKRDSCDCMRQQSEIYERVFNTNYQSPAVSTHDAHNRAMEALEAMRRSCGCKQ